MLVFWRDFRSLSIAAHRACFCGLVWRFDRLAAARVPRRFRAALPVLIAMMSTLRFCHYSVAGWWCVSPDLEVLSVDVITHGLNLIGVAHTGEYIIAVIRFSCVPCAYKSLAQIAECD